MSPVKVSVIVTNYNYARYLARCIDSALGQTYDNIEVIVVDDASQDNSREVIAQYMGRVTPVLQANNLGQGAAFNAGFAASRGEVIFFLDADDWLYPNAVARVVEEMTAGIAQAQFRLHLVNADGVRIGMHPAAEVRFDSGNVVPQLLSRGRFENTVTSGNAFARAALQIAMPIPEQTFRISADGYLVSTVPFVGRIAAIDEPLGSYVIHGGNNWAGSVSAPAQQAARLRRAVLHDLDRFDVLRAAASRFGHACPADPGLNDPLHLSYRLGSLVLDRAGHPLAGDSRFGLTWRGMLASFASNIPLSHRLMSATWFLAVGTLPQASATKVALWRLSPATRSRRVQTTLSSVRRLLGQLHAKLSGAR